MRHWHLGYPLGDIPKVGGRPCVQWINLFVLSHRENPAGWVRTEWPDGQPLLVQSWLQAMIFEAIKGELAAIGREKRRGR